MPHVAYADRNFDSPSGKIEFYSSQADKLGLPTLPVHKVDKGSLYPLALSFGRTLTHFHAFYDEGRALPSLAKHNAAPQLWISRVDAEARQLSNGDGIRIFNERGEFGAARLCLSASGVRRRHGTPMRRTITVAGHGRLLEEHDYASQDSCGIYSGSPALRSPSKICFSSSGSLNSTSCRNAPEIVKLGCTRRTSAASARASSIWPNCA